MNRASGGLDIVPPLSHPLRFVLIALAGWMDRQQRDAIDYLQEENRVLREQLAPRRLRFTDAQRRRLAAQAKLSQDAVASPVFSVRSKLPHRRSTCVLH